jgi:hypothetical protein
MFVFQWFMLNIADPDFQWSSFTRSVYVAHKRAHGLVKQVSSGMAPGEKLDDPSTAAFAFDFPLKSSPPMPRIKLHRLRLGLSLI